MPDSDFGFSLLAFELIQHPQPWQPYGLAPVMEHDAFHG
jgi:hypothetical protein